MTIIPSLIQAWELEPEKRPTFAASRDSLDLFRTQNPQWRRRKTFPRISKKTWEESVFLFKQWELKVTQSTGEESRTVTHTLVTERLFKHKKREDKTRSIFFRSRYLTLIMRLLLQIKMELYDQSGPSPNLVIPRVRFLTSEEPWTTCTKMPVIGHHLIPSSSQGIENTTPVIGFLRRLGCQILSWWSYYP